MKKLNYAIVLASCLLGLSSCGKLNAALDMPEKMDKMNRGMESTNESIRLQKLAVALDQMMKKENQEFLSPIPGDMMAPGQILARALTAQEAVELIYIKLKNINEQTYDDRFPLDPDHQNTNQIVDFERSKLALYYAIQIVATYLPDETVLEIVDKQIVKAGRFRETALQMLMLRADFYDKVMLKASLTSDKLYTVGQVETAIEYNSKIDYICKLPFADLVQVKITGFMDSKTNKRTSLVLNKEMAKNNWISLLNSAQSDVKIAGLSNNESENQAQVASQQARYGNILNTLNNYINSWSN